MILSQKVALPMSHFSFFLISPPYQEFGGKGMEVCFLGRLFGMGSTELSQLGVRQKIVVESLGTVVGRLGNGGLIHVLHLTTTFVRKEYE